ncbi:hypothetical protein [Marinobacter sp.]|uniref:hypothetical protein n=1 Tax=Marinobacter sp. TaxID=50741 RepID=UPI001188FD52|nr:hypothetical protein [Marinobacter sp.]QDP47693.1 MAG: hypothetical protein Tp1102SUR657482_6 [Prokaryotic dsDNA virus sp.]|tara:strand:- start:8822 stop:10780 length:1959 start_codon:yes stop_codon:yes gene_type:complete
MARFVDIQTNFTTGELDPLVRARVELKAYDNALEAAQNVICQPQGGVTRRPGTKFINELTGTPANGVRLVPFEFSVNDSYMLCFTNDTMFVYKNKALVHTESGTNITSALLDNMCWTQSADTLIVVHEDNPPVKIVRGASDTDWTISTITFDSVPKYAFSLVIFDTSSAGHLTPSAVTGKVELTSQHSIFTSAHVGQYINVQPQGRARIVELVSATKVNVVTEFPFFDTSQIANADWELETGYETVWSATRGYPRTVTFHQGRLFFGGSKSRPSTVWGSKVGLFFDFEAVEGLDDDAVEATLDTNTFNAITDIISGRDLQIFTTGGEFYVPQEGLSPITPADFFLSTTSRNGSKEGVRVKQLESGTLFIQRQGKALSEIAYSDTQLTYLTSKISLLAGHLLKNPKRMDIRRAVATDENDLLLIVNSDDGSLAVFSLLRAQDVIAPSEFTTTGTYQDVGVDITDIYVVTTRTDSGSTKYYVEVFDDNSLTDCGVIGTTSATANMAHLEGATVNVLSDGYVEANQVVPGGGTVTFVNPPASNSECGLPISVEIKTMPLNVKAQAGTRIGFRKRVLEVNALLHQTQNIVINNNPVPIRTLGAGALDTAVVPFTGTKVLHGILGYSTDGQITVTQNAPLKLTLLGLEYKVSVYQGR